MNVLWLYRDDLVSRGSVRPGESMRSITEMSSCNSFVAELEEEGGAACDGGCNSTRVTSSASLGFGPRLWRRNTVDERQRASVAKRHKVGTTTSVRGDRRLQRAHSTSIASRIFCPRCHPKQWEGVTLKAGDMLCLSIIAEALPRLRSLSGVRLGPHGATSDDHVAESDCLVEACVRADSPLVGLTVDQAALVPLLEQTVVWGARFWNRDTPTPVDESRSFFHWRKEAPPFPKPSLQRSHSDPSLSISNDSTLGQPAAAEGLNAPRTSLLPKPVRQIDSITIQLELDESVGRDERIPHHRCPGIVRPKVNSLQLAAGDTLLLEASTFFTDIHRYVAARHPNPDPSPRETARWSA